MTPEQIEEALRLARRATTFPFMPTLDNGEVMAVSNALLAAEERIEAQNKLLNGLTTEADANEVWKALILRAEEAEERERELRERWEKDNLCGICPYRMALQDEATQKDAEIERLTEFNAAMVRANERQVQEIAELRAWGQQVHDALDGRPLPKCPDEGPARIERMRALVLRGQTREGEILKSEAEIERLTALLERVRSNAYSWHGPVTPDNRHAKALAVIAAWCDAALDEKSNTPAAEFVVSEPKEYRDFIPWNYRPPWMRRSR